MLTGMFYSSLLDLPQIHGHRQPDVLFVHASGKSRMASLAKSLRELDVPVDIIADIDILRDDGELHKVFEALGGDWSQMQPLAKSVKAAIEQHKPGLNSGDIKKAIEEMLGERPQQASSLRICDLRSKQSFEKHLLGTQLRVPAKLPCLQVNLRRIPETSKVLC